MATQLLEQYMLEADQAFAQEDYVRGKNILEEALALAPDYGEAHNYMGWLYLYHLNNWEQAERHLALAIRYAPKCRGAYVHLSALLTNQARYDELQVLLGKAFQVPGINRVALFNDLGRMYEDLTKYRLAVKYYKEAVKTSMSNAEIDDFRDHIRRCRRKRWVMWM